MAGGILVRPQPGRPVTDHSADGRRARELRRERRAAGLCTGCGAPALRGRALCLFCRDNGRAANRRLRADRRAAGLCQECGAPSQGKARCMTCVLRRARRPGRLRERQGDAKERDARRSARHRAAREAAGLCVQCGKSRDGDWKRCAVCRAADLARCRARREAARPLVGRPLSVQQAAELIGITRTSVQHFVAIGRIPCIRTDRRIWLRIEDVHAFKSEREARPERQRSRVRTVAAEALEIDLDA